MSFQNPFAKQNSKKTQVQSNPTPKVDSTRENVKKTLINALEKQKDNTIQNLVKTSEQIAIEIEQEIYEQNVREDGYEDGLVDGARKKAMEAATNALKMNLSPEQTAAITGLTLREALDLQKQLATESADSPQA